MESFFRNLVNAKGKHGVWSLALLALLGIALLIIPTIFAPSRGQPGPQADTPSVSEKLDGSALNTLEKELAQQVIHILSVVEGVGNVTVSVSLAESPQKDYAQNTSTDQSTVEERDTGGGTRVTMESNTKTEMVFAQGRGEPIIVKETGPEIKGILVVAQGAKDSKIKAAITEAVQTMFGLPAHRVLVLPRK